MTAFTMKAGLLVAACLAQAPLYAQEYPARNVTMIVPFPAGGGADLFARLIGQQLTAIFGKTFIIDNRVGASGNIGAHAVVRSAPDGLTVLYTTSGLASSSAVSIKMPFDAGKDLQAVTMTLSIPQVLVVHPSLPVRNAAQFSELARTKPGAVAYGAAVGAAGHFAMEMLGMSTGTRRHHVPYNGVAPVVTALMSGEIQSAFLVIPVVKPHLGSGRMRAIGISSRNRAAVMPDVPTLEEQGVAAFEALQWHGFFAPSRTPSHVIERLHTAIVHAVKSAEVKDKAASEGSEILTSSPRDFAAFFEREVLKHREVAKRAGMKQGE
jgi:tripartite-type tricarboxylate transporter receptor subunit TctC